MAPAETADFERDTDQGSLTNLEYQDPRKKEKNFLLNELQTIKEQLHENLLLFQAHSQGRRGDTLYNTSSNFEKKFEICRDYSIEDILRKEIDHFFIMTLVLNEVAVNSEDT